MPFTVARSPVFSVGTVKQIEACIDSCRVQQLAQIGQRHPPVEVGGCNRCMPNR